MKTISLLTVAIFLCVGIYSQNPQQGRSFPPGFLPGSWTKGSDPVGNFTITDSDGNTWNLYQHLNTGKTVFLDLFFST